MNCDMSRWRALGTAGSRLAALIVGVVVLAGCQSSGSAPVLPQLFQDGQFDPGGPDAYLVDPLSKYATYEAELCASRLQLPRMDHQDFAMLAANRAMIEEALGDYEAACQAAMNAQAVMTGDVEGEAGKAAAASLGDESEKVFKGECYEIAGLNSFIGLYNLYLGKEETAAIGFRRAIEFDKMSKDGYRDDFNLAFWGLGMSQLHGDMEGARASFRKCGYKTAEVVADENMVFVLSLGRAPGKRLIGLYGEQDVFSGAAYEPHSAEVFVDNRSLGRSTQLVDLLTQSEGVARSGKDVGQGVKAAGKFALAVTAGVFLGRAGSDLVASAWAINADTRTCYMLPNEIHVVSGRVPPGLHTVRIRFFDAADHELPRYEQVWHYVPAPDRGRRYIPIRSEFDRCNVQGPIAFTRVNRVRAGKQDQPTHVRFRAVNLPDVATTVARRLVVLGFAVACRIMKSD